jgi:FtsP/CotA-like multicopper oxidase with cupredoxin domain
MLLALGLCIGCGSDVPLAPVPELVRAVDINPDPNIVEVNLVASEAFVDYVGIETPVLAYRDGSVAGSMATVPGPMIEAKLGDRLIVHFRNELATRSSTVHWHGLRLPIDMDGDPMVVPAVQPGGTFDYDFVLRDEGLFWYHPHVDTDEQIELGLQGPLLVRGLDEPTITVERTFVLDDVDLAGDGSVRLDPSQDDLMLGRHGDTLLVNGKPPGSIAASAGSVERWRLVNTANGRFFDLQLDGLPLHVIGWDGGRIPAPYDVDHLVIAPGERYDIVVGLDRARSSTISLTTLAVVRGHGGVDRAAELVRVELDEEPRERDVIPSTGPSIANLPPASAMLRFVLSEQSDGPAGPVFLINNQRWPANTPIDVALGDVAVWEIFNDADAEHPMHVHGHFFRVLDRDGVPEPRVGWKDTVVLGARSTIHAALQYDEPGKWMFHCQIPEHAERGMTADVNVQP